MGRRAKLLARLRVVVAAHERLMDALPPAVPTQPREITSGPGNGTGIVKGGYFWLPKYILLMYLLSY